MRSTHRGSDFEKASMSSRLSQEMLTATLVTQSVALGPCAPNDAIAAWRTTLSGTNWQTWTQGKKEAFNTSHQYSAELLWRGNDFMKCYIMHLYNLQWALGAKVIYIIWFIRCLTCLFVQFICISEHFQKPCSKCVVMCYVKINFTYRSCDSLGS